MNEEIRQPDPEYVQGQIEATRALIIGLAKVSGSLPQFVQQSLASLEALRVSRLASEASDARLLAIDACESWLRRLE